jgi:hypothetical protein
MDPISAAIVAAVAAGVTKIGGQAIVDAYNGLKDLLRRKLGADSKAVRAVQDLEEEPKSQGAALTLGEQIKKSNADQDEDLLKAAQALLEQIKAQPGGEKIVQQVTGSYNALAAGGSIATVNVNVPPKP